MLANIVSKLLKKGINYYKDEKLKSFYGFILHPS